MFDRYFQLRILDVKFLQIYYFFLRLLQVTLVGNANVAPTVITAFLLFRMASAFRVVATWQEV